MTNDEKIQAAAEVFLENQGYEPYYTITDLEYAFKSGAAFGMKLSEEHLKLFEESIRHSFKVREDEMKLRYENAVVWEQEARLMHRDLQQAQDKLASLETALQKISTVRERHKVATPRFQLTLMEYIAREALAENGGEG